MFHQSGASKKKLLTDPVKIIPFPNQDLRDKASKPAVAKPSAKKPLKKVFDKPEPKVLSAPSGNKRYSSSISINKMMAPKDDGEDGASIDFSNMPMNDYHFDDLKMAWRRYAHILKEQGEKTFYNALIKRDPIPKPDDVFLMQVDNQVQIDSIRPRLSEILGYLRKELRNYNINIKLEITNNPDEEVKFQTGKDRFAALARKNPNLHTLKKTFNLDIEF
ncbi:MAG: hypothetical protein HWE22_14280 [Flavobacteriales bacterium]|nr:hypothetical protein [Flavobacteriales bacterium]